MDRKFSVQQAIQANFRESLDVSQHFYTIERVRITFGAVSASPSRQVSHPSILPILCETIFGLDAPDWKESDMSFKLKRKMASLGVLKGKTLSEIEAVCGAPVKSMDHTFSGLGKGTQKAWGTPLYRVILNFDRDDVCFGIAKQSSPLFSAVLVCAVVAAALFLIYRQAQIAAPQTVTCQICGATYSADDPTGNYASIEETGMCSSCFAEYTNANEMGGS